MLSHDNYKHDGLIPALAEAVCAGMLLFITAFGSVVPRELDGSSHDAVIPVYAEAVCVACW